MKFDFLTLTTAIFCVITIINIFLMIQLFRIRTTVLNICRSVVEVCKDMVDKFESGGMD